MSLDHQDFYDLACRLGEHPMQTLALAENMGIKALLTPPEESHRGTSTHPKVLKLGPITRDLDGEHLPKWHA